MAVPEKEAMRGVSLRRGILNNADLIAILTNQARYPDRQLRMILADGKTITYNPYRQIKLASNNLFVAMDRSKKIEIIGSSSS